MANVSLIEECVLSLHKIGAFKFGSFILKSGITSPFYFDLRVIFSYPQILDSVVNLLWDAISVKSFDSICGVPYTALPLATVISIKHNIPMLIKRKEIKSYGTKQLLEGEYHCGQSCIIIEDVIVSGSSIRETLEVLRHENIIVTEAVVFLDRQQGGIRNIAALGVNVTSVTGITEVLNILHKYEKIDDAMLKQSLNFFKTYDNIVIPSTIPVPFDSRRNDSLSDRFGEGASPLARKIVNLILMKQSNLCVAVDVCSSMELLEIADLVGPHICILKTHVDILNDFTMETISKLKDLALRHDFLLFEDRKFSDIGNTVRMQYSEGIYKISEWADIVTVHGIPGPGVIKGLTSISSNEPRGILIVAEMSSSGNLADTSYAEGCLKLAENFSEDVLGFIAQSRISENPKFLIFTPGVNLTSSDDDLGQKYVSVEEAIVKKGSDVIIVGRGITAHAEPKLAAQQYQVAAYEALLKRTTIP